MLHKPLTQLEAAGLYRELKQVMAEDAARRDAATQFSSDYQPRWNNGEGNFPVPLDTPRGRADEQAAAMIPGGASYKTLEKIGYLEQVASDETRPAGLRAEAAAGLARIEAGEPVHPIYQTIRDADTTAREQREAALHAIAAETMARADQERKRSKRSPKKPPEPAVGDGEPARYPVRAFVQTWGELTDWWTHYDAAVLAQELTDEQVDNFLTTAEGTAKFAQDLRDARAAARADTDPPRLRAL